MLAVVLIAVAALVVFAIAAGAIGREAHRLDAVAPRAVFILDDAVDYVADHIPEEMTPRLTMDEVRQIVVWQMSLLHEKGLTPSKANDQRQTISEELVIDPTNAVGYVLARSDELGLDVFDEDLAAVVEANFGYLESIGAIGPPAEGSQDAQVQRDPDE